ncbi:MAG: PD-(D/E)XK nuclease family protein [Alphaproteobacteria bacterium]|nr:PD-(D/E)XK nuclease family protein [Alphaproteobacteria bacterium]
MAIHVLFGRTRPARRRGVAALLRPGRDALGRSTTLYVTGTWRKRAQLLRELEARDGLLPDVTVFEAWLVDAGRRCGDGRAPLSRRAAALATRRWAAERGVVLDAAEARALADAERVTAAWGRPPRDPAVAARVADLRAWLDRLPRHAREGRRLHLLLGALERGEGVRAHGAVVLDDLHGLSPLAARVCVAACRAWSAAGAEVVLSFGLGRDRGGVEVGQALGFEEADDREDRVFETTRALRTAVFDELVASGEATLLRYGEGGLLEVEPGATLPAAAPDLADDLAGGRPCGAPGFGPIRLGPMPDPRAEVERVARRLRRILEDGADPRDCLVALPSALYDPLVAEIFAEHDLPWERGGGTSAATHPTTLAVRRALALGAELPTDELLALADAAGIGGIRVLWAACRAAGVRSGHPSTWEPRLRAWAVRTRAEIDPLLAGWPAVASLVARLPDPSVADPEALARSALVLISDADPAVERAVLEAAEALGRDLGCLGDPEPEIAREALVAALDGLVVERAGPEVARVPVVGLRERVGLTPRHTFVVGLARGMFPGDRRPSSVLGPEDPVDHDPVAEGRMLLADLLRDALGEPWMESVELSWPAATDGRPTLPSPLVAEWLELVADWPALPEPETAGADERIRRACGLPDGGGLPEVLAARARVGARTGDLGPHDGVLRRPPRAPRELPVTTLETYLRCPQRYWYRHVLRLDDAEPWAPELEPRRRGTALHRILEGFLLDRQLRPLSGEPDPDGARRALRAVADRVLDEVDAEGGFDPVYQTYARDRWTAGLVDDRPHGILRAWLDVEMAGPQRIPEAVERSFGALAVGPIALRGTIDRVDRVPGGARLVTDYKTGRTPTRDEVLLGLSLQPAAYLAATRAADASLPVAASFLSLARPDDLRRTAWTGHPDALAIAAEERERRSATPLDDRGLAEVLGRAAAAAERLVTGAFPPSPHPPERAGCPTCPYRTICRRDEERHAAPDDTD